MPKTDETPPDETHTIEVIETADDTVCSGRTGCKSNRLTQHTGRPWVCSACESGSNSPLAVFGAQTSPGSRLIIPR